MIRNLKALGLLAFAALAMSAMFASAAQAQTNGVLTAGHNEAEPKHTTSTIVGHQYPKIDAESSEEEIHDWETWNFFEGVKGSAAEDEIRCDIATLTGTTKEGTEKEIKVAPHYTHCDANGQDATVQMNGCEYLLEQPTKTEPNTYEGGAALTCPEHKRIEVDVFLSTNATNTSQFFQVCTIEIYPGEAETVGEHTVDPLGGRIVYHNIDKEATKDDITATVEVEGITSFDGCNNEHHTNGTYTSTVTVEALEDKEEPHTEQFDLWISDEVE